MSNIVRECFATLYIRNKAHQQKRYPLYEIYQIAGSYHWDSLLLRIVTNSGFRELVAFQIEACILAEPTNRLYGKQTSPSLEARTMIKTGYGLFGGRSYIFFMLFHIHRKTPLILFYQHNHIIYKLKKQKNVVKYPFFVVKLLADLKTTKIPAYAAGIFQSCYSITHP